VRFLLVDAIVEIEPGVRATGLKNVTMSEDFLADHFPHRPIMPGVMIIEGLVQLADWLIRHDSDFTKIGLASGFDRIKFRRVVRPGDRIRLEVEVMERGEEEVRLKGRASTEVALAASANLTLALHPIEDYIDPHSARHHFGLLRWDTTGEPP
jgi:3-hydroxyacyl-[acyl-carrier-protein] dehydratase